MKITIVADNPFPAIRSQGTTMNGLYVGNIRAGNFGIKNAGYRQTGVIPRSHHTSMWATAHKWPKNITPWPLMEGVDVMVFLGEYWQTMSITEKETWRKEANRRRITIFAAFVKINYYRANDGSTLLRTYH